MINGYSQESMVKLLHDGMLKSIRDKLKTNLMNSLEKDVDTAIEEVIRGMQGYVEASMDHMSGNTVFNVLIKKHQPVPTRTPVDKLTVKKDYQP